MRVSAASGAFPRAACALCAARPLPRPLVSARSWVERCARNAQSWSFCSRILQLDDAAPLSCLMDEAEALSWSRVCFQQCFQGCDGLCSTLNLFKRGCMSSGLLKLLMDWCFNCMSSMTEHYKLWLDREQFRAVCLWQLEKKPQPLFTASLKSLFFSPLLKP